MYIAFVTVWVIIGVYLGFKLGGAISKYGLYSNETIMSMFLLTMVHATGFLLTLFVFYY